MRTIETMRERLLGNWIEATHEMAEEQKNNEYDMSEWENFITTEQQMMRSLRKYVEDDKDLIEIYTTMISVYFK